MCRSHHGAVASLAAAVLSGCLEGGPPPQGALLLAGRDVQGMAFLPSVRGQGDAAARLVMSRVRPDGSACELLLLTEGGSSGPVEPRVVLEWTPSRTMDGQCPLPEVSLDAAGRLYVLPSYFDSDSVSGWTTRKLFRVDLTTGDPPVDLGMTSSLELSSGGTRAFVVRSNTRGAFTDAYLIDSDDTVVELGRGYSGAFIGEDLYFLAAEARLLLMRPGAAAAPLAEQIGSFSVLREREDSPLLSLSRFSAAGSTDTNSAYSVLDPRSMHETPLPGPPLSLSASGRWLPAQTWDVPTAAGQLYLVELASGAVTSLPFSWLVQWRAGRDELWITRDTYDPASLFVIRPGQETLELALPPDRSPEWNYLAVGALWGQGLLTPDGRYWLSGEHTDVDGVARIFAGSADDPLGPRVLLNPAGTRLNRYWQLSDGRLVVEACYDVSYRSELYVVDPVSGTSERVAEAGAGMAVAGQRVLAIEHNMDARHPGELTLIDLESGRRSTLAHAVSQVLTEDPRPGQDVLGTGAPVAVMVRNAPPSRYDGIWLVRLP